MFASKSWVIDLLKKVINKQKEQESNYHTIKDCGWVTINTSQNTYYTYTAPTDYSYYYVKIIVECYNVNPETEYDAVIIGDCVVRNAIQSTASKPYLTVGTRVIKMAAGGTINLGAYIVNGSSSRSIQFIVDAEATPIT